MKRNKKDSEEESENYYNYIPIKKVGNREDEDDKIRNKIKMNKCYKKKKKNNLQVIKVKILNKAEKARCKKYKSASILRTCKLKK